MVPTLSKRETPDHGSDTALNSNSVKGRGQKSSKTRNASPAGPHRHFAPGFWESPSLDELAEIQDVRQANLDDIIGTWPGDIDDGFEEAITALRSEGVPEKR